MRMDQERAEDRGYALADRFNEMVAPDELRTTIAHYVTDTGSDRLSPEEALHDPDFVQWCWDTAERDLVAVEEAAFYDRGEYLADLKEDRDNGF